MKAKDKVETPYGNGYILRINPNRTHYVRLNGSKRIVNVHESQIKVIG